VAWLPAIHSSTVNRDGKDATPPALQPNYRVRRGLFPHQSTGKAAAAAAPATSVKLTAGNRIERFGLATYRE
jgi:hypothetical protein